jgi:hypothetical protein
MFMDGGGFGRITGTTFDIKQEAVTPDSASGLTAAYIEQLFSFLPEPSLVAESGAAHTAASEVLADIADSLVKHVQVLSGAWSGTASQAAADNFQLLHETAIGLAQASAKTGAVLSWLGETILPFYKSYRAPQLSLLGHVEAALGDNPQDHAAQQVMERLNNRLVQANDNLPSSVSVHLPTGWIESNANLMSSAGPGAAGAGAAAAALAVGGAGAGVGRLVSSGAGGTGADSGGGAAVGSLGRGSPGATDHLASAPGGAPGSVSPGDPGAGGAGAPGAVAPGGPGGGGGSLPVLPGAPGAPGGVVSGEGVPSGEVPGGPGLAAEGAGGDGMIGDGVVGVAPGDSAVIGSDGMIGMPPGDPGGPGLDGLAEGGFAEGSLGVGDTGGSAGAAGFAGADEAATDAADQGATGGTGFPMGGTGAGGRRETERRRQAWMAEDADVWEGQTDTAPSQIGV